MMHSLRNRKIGPKSAHRRFIEVRLTLRAAVYQRLAGTLRHSNSNFQAFVGFKTRV